jgi:tetratricopeptide (TPR) repeat protein
MGLFGRGRARRQNEHDVAIAHYEAMAAQAGNAAEAEGASGRWDDALMLSEVSLKAVAALAQLEPGDPRHLHGEAASLYFHASALGRNGRVAEAVDAADRAAALYRRLRPQNPARYDQLIADAEERGERWRAELAGTAASEPEGDIVDLLRSAADRLLGGQSVSPEVASGLSALGVTLNGAGSGRAGLARTSFTLADHMSAKAPDEALTIRQLRLRAHQLFAEGSETQEAEMRIGFGDYGTDWARTLLVLARQDQESGDTSSLQEHCGWLAGVLGQLRPYTLVDGPTAALVQEADAFLQGVDGW